MAASTASKETSMDNVIPMEVESRSGVAFPKKLDDGTVLIALGLRKKGLLAFQLKIYAFGIYADATKLKDVLKSKFPESPESATKELYEAAIDADVGMTVRLVMVFGRLSMSTIRKSFDESLGASLKKLSGQKDDEILQRVMGDVSDSLKLPTGSEIEITRIPGQTLQTKVKGEIVSTLESELLCRAYFHLYLGDEPFDREAKEKVGSYLFSLVQEN